MEDEAKKKLKEEQKKAEKEAKMAKFLAKKEKQQAAKTQSEADKDKPKEEKAKPAKKEKVVEEKYVNTTPAGEKKDTSIPMRNAYEPVAVESAWYDWWEKKGYFHADQNNKNSTFVIVIPPPNVTGKLHLGHGLTNAVQDSIVRWHRMNGKNTLWVPGTDHAGIATQTVVEKKLQKQEGKTRHDYGREKFLAEVWKWKEEYGGNIIQQLKRLGGSYDWTREVFTLDDKLSRAVTEAFVRLFERKLIYRDNRLVNWSCKLNTAIADIEVEELQLEGIKRLQVPGHEGTYEFGAMWDIAYKIDGEDSEIIVSTTRPETLLGDTAIAVHPNDEKFKKFHGKFALHPFFDRKIPIIPDGILVTEGLGTGAVKVTPAHDPEDYKCGKRNNLEFINILNENGTINENGGQFQGMMRYDARYAVLDALKAKGLFKGVKDHKTTIGLCSRSKDVIEPLLKPQWYVDCKDMGAAAKKAVEDKQLEIIPSNYEAVWNRWLGNIQDWCISRQLWWGHRCPAYLIVIEGQEKSLGKLTSDWVVGRNQEEALKNARAQHPDIAPERISVEQDEDVLDTWFSSALFPFSVFGWPDNTKDLETFYPTSLLETGHDIIFFWVARMVMMGLTLTGKLPFKQVFLHAMVRDSHGKKMSKSLGNVVDPVDMITGIPLAAMQEQLLTGNLDPKELERATAAQKADFPNGIPECGTDAMRFALCAYTSQGRDINLDVNRVAAYRNFCNKLWNATKFALMNLGPDFKPAKEEKYPETPSIWDQWILSRLNAAIKSANEGFAKYEFAQTTTAIYNFWLYELCDVYLESLKPVMQGNDEKKKATARETLYTCLDNGLRLLHPFMPFVTEELFQRLIRRESLQTESICIASYPTEKSDWNREEIEKDVKLTQEIIKSIRVSRATFGLTKEKPKVFINLHQQALLNSVTPFTETICFLSHSSEIQLLFNEKGPQGCAVEIVNDNCEIYLQLQGVVDFASEIGKLEKKKAKVNGDYEKLLKLTQGAHYGKVPENLKAENTEKLAAFTKEIDSISHAISSFKSLLESNKTEA